MIPNIPDEFIAEHPIEIEPFGAYLTTDENGYLISRSYADKIKDPWKTALMEMVDVTVAHLGKDNVKSILARGSVSRGEPHEGVSDIDIITLVADPHSVKNREWRHQVDEDLTKKYPFATGFDFGIWSYDSVLATKSTGKKFTLKTQATTIYGEDLIPKLPNFKPDHDMAKLLTRYFHLDIEDGIERLSNSASEEDLLSACRWISKRILRNGFYMIMPETQVFTRDLYPAYAKFAGIYPKQASQMYTALYLAINPTLNKNDFLNYAKNFGGWITSEINRKYS